MAGRWRCGGRLDHPQLAELVEQGARIGRWRSSSPLAPARARRGLALHVLHQPPFGARVVEPREQLVGSGLLAHLHGRSSVPAGAQRSLPPKREARGGADLEAVGGHALLEARWGQLARGLVCKAIPRPGDSSS